MTIPHRRTSPRPGLHLAQVLGASRARSTGARICVVGAGAAGLAAAHALDQGGYRRVTVLERSDRPGGKCWSFVHDGRVHEMGAVVLSPAYKDVRALMRSVGLRLSPKLHTALFLDVDARRGTHVPIDRNGHAVRSLLALGGLELELLRHARLRRPGFAGAHRSLCVPFSRWLRAHRLEAAGRLVAPWITPLGYGYVDEIPALYVLKYLPLIRFPLCEIDSGFQELWRRVAARLDVRYGVEVVSIRRGATVTVETTEERLAFDALLLACPLDDALAFLDATDEERRLFSRIRWESYQVFAALTEGLPDARWTHFPNHFSRERAGWPVFMMRRWTGSGLRVFYTLARPGQSLDESEEHLRETVARLGGRVTGIHLRHAWRYFPHVSSEDLADGFYDALEGLQGQRSTYYVGELLSFATVENTTAYARDLVARCFVEPGVRGHAR